MHCPGPNCILVAEDDAFVRYLNSAALAGSGYHVDAAEDGAAAWDSLQNKAYQLLITDHNMPKMSGIELIEKMRAANMTTPVILISADIPKEALEDPRLQIHATLAKPYPIAVLLSMVEELLGGIRTAGQV